MIRANFPRVFSSFHGIGRMELDSAPSSLGLIPRRFQAKNGLSLCIQMLSRSFLSPFLDAYLAFRPRHSFQGLPPLKDEACVKWVREMIVTGVNLIAVGPGSEIAGHVAVFPVDRRRCEMIVVVWPEFQNIGIGTELTRNCVLLAAELGYEEMWLPVEATNLRARHIYAKCGFECRSPQYARELEMVCDLSRHRPKVADVVRVMERLMENTKVPPLHFQPHSTPAAMPEQALT
jgi:ribosomal protein S18 acetylase RimI-like enzyme